MQVLKQRLSCLQTEILRGRYVTHVSASHKQYMSTATKGGHGCAHTLHQNHTTLHNLPLHQGSILSLCLYEYSPTRSPVPDAKKILNSSKFECRSLLTRSGKSAKSMENRNRPTYPSRLPSRSGLSGALEAPGEPFMVGWEGFVGAAVIDGRPGEESK